MPVTSGGQVMKSKDSKPVIGWREWVELPSLGIRHIKAKVDTGARTSALHASDIEYFSNRRKVRFSVHPLQRNRFKTVTAEATVIGRRSIKSSVGHVTVRPVIRTDIILLNRKWEIEITLVNRDQMGFRMLLGRQAIRGLYTVDPGRSFLAGQFKPAKKKKRIKRRKRIR